MSQEKGFSPGGTTQCYVNEVHAHENRLILNTVSTLTCVFYSQMGHQEFLFRSGVFAVVTLERSVVSMRQLVVEQQLLVVTSVVAKLTLEPGKYTIYT